MPKPRNVQISLQDTPYYHCVTRCVRRSFLCGIDKYSNKSYEHRREWVEKRIHFLASVFAIDVCAYAVMSNHTHVVLHVDSSQAEDWSVEEVIMSWHKLFSGTLLTQRYMDNAKKLNMTDAQIRAVHDTVNVWRKRLRDISWFMRCLNEYIARQANKEDNCTGRFWEGRFKSQALLDEAAILACMAYVDLNPVRAKMAKTPESSSFTSFQYRVNAMKKQKSQKYLMPFSGGVSDSSLKALPYSLPDYLRLVDETGKHVRQDKRGAIDNSIPDILTRLGIQNEHWLELTTRFEQCFNGAAGRLEYLERYSKNRNITRVHCKHASLRLLG